MEGTHILFSIFCSCEAARAEQRKYTFPYLCCAVLLSTSGRMSQFNRDVLVDAVPYSIPRLSVKSNRDDSLQLRFHKTSTESYFILAGLFSRATYKTAITSIPDRWRYFRLLVHLCSSWYSLKRVTGIPI